MAPNDDDRIKYRYLLIGRVPGGQPKLSRRCPVDSSMLFKVNCNLIRDHMLRKVNNIIKGNALTVAIRDLRPLCTSQFAIELWQLAIDDLVINKQFQLTG